MDKTKRNMKTFMNRKQRSTTGLGIASVVIALATSLGSLPANAASEAPVAAEVKTPTVTASVAKSQLIIEQTYASGTLVARDEILVYPKINGFAIETLTVELGQSVQKGDILATLSTENLRVQLSQAHAEIARSEAAARQAENQITTAQAALTQAKAQLDRALRLKESGSATQSNLDNAVAQEQTARAALASAEDGVSLAHATRAQAQAGLDLATLNMQRANITAPTSGVIAARNGQVGGVATSAGEPLFRIIANGIVDAELDLIESALADVQIGDPVSLKVSSIGAIDGVVHQISPTVDARTRLATVTVALPERSHLRPGLFAEGVIQTDARENIAVPTTAVLNDGEVDYVLRISDGIISRQNVAAGALWKGSREITAGLAEGDVLVARAGAFFSDGDEVHVVQAQSDVAHTTQEDQ